MAVKIHRTIKLFGSFSIKPANQRTMRRKTRALLAYLVATSHAHTRSHLMSIFCQEADAPARVLTLLVSRLRSHIGKNTVLSNAGIIQLDLSAVDVDYLQFCHILDQPIAQQETAGSLFHHRYHQLTGRSLPDQSSHFLSHYPYHILPEQIPSIESLIEQAAEHLS